MKHETWIIFFFENDRTSEKFDFKNSEKADALLSTLC
jgi:hypothetical protein